jgi:hypothetical protein
MWGLVNRIANTIVGAGAAAAAARSSWSRISDGF